MTVTIDANKLRRHISGKYKGIPDEGDHQRFFWEIDGKTYGGAKFSHGSKKADLPDFVASSIARKLNVTRAELKKMEGCSFNPDELWNRLVQDDRSGCLQS